MSFRPFALDPHFRLILSPKAILRHIKRGPNPGHTPHFVLSKCSREKGLGHFVPEWQLGIYQEWIPLDIQTIIVDENREWVGRGNLLNLSRNDTMGLDILFLDKVYRSLGGKGILNVEPKLLLYSEHQKRWVLAIEVEIFGQSRFGAPCDWTEVSELKSRVSSEYQDPFLQIALHIL